MVLLDRPKAVWPVHWPADPTAGSAGPTAAGTWRADRDGHRVDGGGRFAGFVPFAASRTGSAHGSDRDDEAEEEADRSGRVRSAAAGDAGPHGRAVGNAGHPTWNCRSDGRARRGGPCRHASSGRVRDHRTGCRCASGCDPDGRGPGRSGGRRSGPRWLGPNAAGVRRSPHPSHSRRASRAASGDGAGDRP